MSTSAKSEPAKKTEPARPALTDLLILGAGAAGLMAALTASHKGRSVVLAEAGPVAGRKIRIAGGGRGNFTNLQLGPEHYSGADPAFVRPALRAFPASAVLQLLDSFALPYDERDHGQIFGQLPAVRLVEALTTRILEQGTQILYHYEALTLHKTLHGFAVEFDTPQGPVQHEARSVLLACGSPAWPDAGATSAGPRLLRDLRENMREHWRDTEAERPVNFSDFHDAEPFRPALTPFILPPNNVLSGLQGLSAEVALQVGSRQFTLPLLFTHKGLSGPAALQASCFWQANSPLIINFAPSADLKALMHAPENGKTPASTLLRRHMPQRLADRLFAEARQQLTKANLLNAAVERGVAQWSRPQREILLNLVHNFHIMPQRLEGMHHAEAAAGGIRTKNINPKTMESCIVPGLFMAGEVLDITGALGGYNLHWAFASGFLAGSCTAAR